MSAPKPKPKSEPAAGPDKVLWRYDSPPGFHLLEPAYGLPTEIKWALMQFVQPVPELCKAYAEVFTDKRTFATWFKGVLNARKKAIESGPTVLSSDFSKMSPPKGTVISTTATHSRAAKEQDEIEKALTVLKVWDPE